MVCRWRALAQGRTSTPLFDDPTALKLLPESDPPHSPQPHRDRGEKSEVKRA